MLWNNFLLKIWKYLGNMPVKSFLRKHFLKYINFNYSIKAENNLIKMPYIYGMHSYYNEPWMYEILQQILHHKKGVVIDIGANVGQTLIKIKAVDKDRECLIFEPNPACVFYIRELIRVNFYNNCEVFPLGLYNSNKILPLKFQGPALEDPMATIISPDNKPHLSQHSIINVPVFSLDNAVSCKSGKICLIKIDVEGAELEVIEGAINTLKGNLPVLLLEILPSYDSSILEARQDKLTSLLNGIGYKFFVIEKKENECFLELRAVNNLRNKSSQTSRDYLVIHEKSADILNRDRTQFL